MEEEDFLKDPGTTECVDPWNGPEKDTLVQIYFWLDGVLRSIVASVGLLGNIFAMIVFSSKELKSNFNLLLSVLALFDSGYLILTLIEEALQMYDITSQGTLYPDPIYDPNVLWVNLYPKFIRPFKFIFFTAAEFFTVLIAVDRYVAIRYPFFHFSRRNRNHVSKRYINRRSAKENHSLTETNQVNYNLIKVYSASILLLSTIYCLPVFFEYEKIPASENNTASVNETAMNKSESYTIIYYVTLDIIFRFLIPVSILLYTNQFIYKTIKNQAYSPNLEAAYQRRAQIMMLFGVVIMLIIVHLYRFGLNVYQIPIHANLVDCGKDAKNQIMHLVAFFLITLNSSVNCFIYLVASKKFRNVALEKYLKLLALCPTWQCANSTAKYSGKANQDQDGLKCNDRKR